MPSPVDAVVIGAGPNGLSAAVALAERGHSVLVLEANPTVGGGARTEAWTLPGFLHDTCSAVHPLAAGSPFLRTLPLARHGLDWIHSPLPLAHPFPDGSAALLERDVSATAQSLGEDARSYAGLMGPLVEQWDALTPDLLAPLRIPRRPLAMARFGIRGLGPADTFARARFKGEKARGLFAGLAAHSMLPLDRLATAGFGLVLGMAGHAVGWPVPRGGSQRIADALAAHLTGLGGAIETGRRVASLDQLPASRVVLCDVTPRQLLSLAGSRLPSRYRGQLARYRYGIAAFKMDWALSRPVPWTAEACHRAATIHLGGSLENIAAAERRPWRGEHAEHPYVLVAQPSLFDPTRAPPGQQTLWAYCHVPSGSTVDMSGRIEAQIERFAPGFRDCILARRVTTPADLERHNANYVGGDINGGVQDLWQTVARPVLRWDPYATPLPGLFLCSSSTPPGGGVHGMCGYHAAQSALRYLHDRRS